MVYLTSHPAPPTEELAASVAREPGDWLGWLSWRDVWSAVRTSELLPARDLADILAAKGLKGFDGFCPRTWVPPGQPWHYWLASSKRWFAQPVQAFPLGTRFWHPKRESL